MRFSNFLILIKPIGGRTAAKNHFLVRTVFFSPQLKSPQSFKDNRSGHLCDNNFSSLKYDSSYLLKCDPQISQRCLLLRSLFVCFFKPLRHSVFRISITRRKSSPQIFIQYNLTKIQFQVLD